ITLAFILALVAAFGLGAGQNHGTVPAGLRFEIWFPASAHAGAITGRVFVMISRTGDREPRLQVGRTGVPFFGRDVEQLAPGQAATIDQNDLGSPVEHLRDLPPGDYFVQGFVNIYSEFKRADGYTVWMHDDQWEGQRWNVSPGNLKSAVQRVHLDPNADVVVKLSAADVIPPITVPPDTEYVKRFKFQSSLLTKFWGRPIYLGATALLPKNYARETISYPVHYIQGHFGLGAPNGFDGVGNNAFSKAWLSDDFPRMILITFQHPTPYFDDSYAVNSVNVGPYGDAIMQELIPEIEKRYRAVKEPYARTLSGGSTGGWESLALQIFHPDFFGGTWSACPDPVTFTDVEGINVYQDKNAFYKQYDWRREPTVNSRETDGSIRLTSEQRNRFELVSGTHGRSGEQIDIWSAVFGPLGKDGYFEPLFNKMTGEMNPDVAQYWKDHFDLLAYLKRDWTSVGPKIVGKIHVYTGTMDTYELNNSTQELEKWMKTTENPHYEGYFLYGDRKPHCWSGPAAPSERLKEIATFIMARKPDGATTPWWRY
ncbi:MAG: alpha/beta hydrolase-fold protein, partial [Acidobacteriota bacterium]